MFSLRDRQIHKVRGPVWCVRILVPLGALLRLLEHTYFPSNFTRKVHIFVKILTDS